MRFQYIFIIILMHIFMYVFLISTQLEIMNLLQDINEANYSFCHLDLESN